MNFRNLIIIGFGLILIAVNCGRKCDPEESRKRIIELEKECVKEVEALSIVTYAGDRICYLYIKDKNIINEFRHLIIGKTKAAEIYSGQFSRRTTITMKTKNELYTILLHSEPYGSGIPKDMVRISFYPHNKFDIYDSYVAINKTPTGIGDFNIDKYGQYSACEYLQDNKLDDFIEKYLVGTVDGDYSNKEIWHECREH
ncbi:MAG: hypothetical protein EPN93_09090 [Spirochaetes bacterium]|nr:MAG: hypothetical protein EPN93_09090 [Spirochaetota bacterium]